MGLIEVHLHDAEFSFAAFSSTDGNDDTELEAADDGTESDNDLYFPNDEDAESSSSGFGRLLVLLVVIVAAVALRRFVGGDSDEVEDFGDDDE